TKEISLCREEHSKVSEIFSSVMMAKFALATVSLLVMSVLVYFIPRFRHDWPVYILSFGTVAGSTLFPMWFFQGTEKMKHIAEINIAGAILYGLSIFILIHTPEDYLMVPIITSITSLTVGVLGQYIVFRRFGIFFKFPEYKSFRRQMKAGWDIF